MSSPAVFGKQLEFQRTFLCVPGAFHALSTRGGNLDCTASPQQWDPAGAPVLGCSETCGDPLGSLQSPSSRQFPSAAASKTECLNLTMTEVVKRQNSKSKKSFNQISVSQIKVDKAQIIGVQSSFAVCLDQDEQKILQSVTRCEISVCYKPRDSDPLALRGSPGPAQDSEFHSLLCLPIATFSGALP